MFLVKKRAEICMGIARGEQRERPESGGRRSREERKKPEQRSESEREKESAREGARGAAPRLRGSSSMGAETTCMRLRAKTVRAAP